MSFPLHNCIWNPRLHTCVHSSNVWWPYHPSTTPQVDWSPHSCSSSHHHTTLKMLQQVHPVLNHVWVEVPEHPICRVELVPCDHHLHQLRLAWMQSPEFDWREGASVGEQSDVSTCGYKKAYTVAIPGYPPIAIYNTVDNQILNVIICTIEWQIKQTYSRDCVVVLVWRCALLPIDYIAELLPDGWSWAVALGVLYFVVQIIDCITYYFMS